MRVLRASVGRRLHRVPVGARRGLVRGVQPARSPAVRPTPRPPRPAPSATLPPVPQDELRSRRRRARRHGGGRPRRRGLRLAVVVVASSAAARPATGRRRPAAPDDRVVGDVVGDVIGDVIARVTSPASSPTTAAAAAADCTEHVDYRLPHRAMSGRLLFPDSQCSKSNRINWGGRGPWGWRQLCRCVESTHFQPGSGVLRPPRSVLLGAG